MDGTLAVIFFLGALGDTALGRCDGPCFARAEAAHALYLRDADEFFNGDHLAAEYMIEYDPGFQRGGLQPRMALGINDMNATWVGIGASWRAEHDGLFVESAFLPGWQFPANDTPDLGGRLQFRSSLGVGYQFDNGISMTLVIDHRSNGDTQPVNPGLESIGLRLGYTFD